MAAFSVILTFIGVIVAIAALGYQMRQMEAARETARRQEETARRQEEATRETARRQEVGVAEWMRDLRVWASDAIEVLSEAVYASDGKPEPVPGDARRHISRLSALIDRGRLFLPNQYPDSHGTDKPPAFRGYRHAALDPLVSALIVLEGTVKDETLHDYVVRNRRAVLRELQMEFVSHIQQILDPESRNQKIAQLIEKSEAQAEKILGRKSLGFRTEGLVHHVVDRLKAKEGPEGPMERQEGAAPGST